MKKILLVLFLLLPSTTMPLLGQEMAKIGKPRLKSEKKYRNAPPATMFLIPSGYTARIGFIEDGLMPAPISTYQNTGRLISRIGGANQPYWYNIYNPSFLAGLPDFLVGLVLTGLASDRTQNNHDRIFLSFSDVNHHILTADLLGTDYNISADLILSAPSTPASAGWVLHDIEMSNIFEMYGCFYNSTNNVTVVSEINMTTGNCTPVTTLPSTRLAGLEVHNNDLYLLNYRITVPSVSYGIVHHFLTNGTFIANFDLQLPFSNPNAFYNTNFGAGSYGYDFFLGFKQSTYSFCLYNGGGAGSTMYNFDDAINPLPPAYPGTSDSWGFDTGISDYYKVPLNFIITDCAN